MQSDTTNLGSIPVVILCGGSPVTFGENVTQPTNKALLQVQGKPLFWWVVHHYAQYGHRNIVLATGYQGEQFGAALEALGAKRNHDGSGYTLPMGTHTCTVRLLPTGVNSTTAQRLVQCRALIGNAQRFCMTYSDTLSDIDLGREMHFHITNKCTATLAAVKPPTRFRILGIRQGDHLVRAFASRPIIDNVRINGGFYIFESAVWEQLANLDPRIALENEPIEALASSAQLAAFEHNGKWQFCDSARDLQVLQQLTTPMH